MYAIIASMSLSVLAMVLRLPTWLAIAIFLVASGLAVLGYIWCRKLRGD